MAEESYTPQLKDKVTVKLQVIHYNQTTGHQTVMLTPKRVARVIGIGIVDPLEEGGKLVMLRGRSGVFYQKADNLRKVGEYKNFLNKERNK